MGSRTRAVLGTFVAIGLSHAAGAMAADRLILGAKFDVKDPVGLESKRKIVGIAKERSTDVPAPLSDPTVSGAKLTVVANGTHSTSQIYILDASGWSKSGTGYRYRGPTGADGDPVKSVLLKRSSAGVMLLKVSLKGSAGTQSVDVLPPNQGESGGFVLEVVGGDRYCAAFGAGAGGTETRDTAAEWQLKSAADEPGCPATPPPPNSTTTTTLPSGGPSPLCPLDATRTIFAGGPGTSACHQFDGDEPSCSHAFHVGGNCGPASCFFDFQSNDCRGCGPENEQEGQCVNTCQHPAPSCPGDPSRTIFAGFSQASSCYQLSFSKSLCEKAFQVSGVGIVASCFWSDENEDCEGCGPSNLTEGRCQNTCPVCAGDPSRTNFAGYPGYSGCTTITTQSSCESAFVIGDTMAATACFWTGAECLGCGPNNQRDQLCVNSCPVCEEDPARQIFLGGPGGGPCDLFSNSPSLCQQAFLMSGECNELASCFYNYDDGRCEGCGAYNREAGLCHNECRGPVCGDNEINLPGEQCDGTAGGCAANDVCAGDCTCKPCTGTPIPAAGGTFVGTTSGISALAGTCGNSGSSGEQLFEWTPAVSGNAVINTCNSPTNYDTVLYVRSGGCGGSELACSDDACAGARSLVTLPVTAGTTYTIVVDGFGGSAGTFALQVIPPGGSPSAAFVDLP